VINKIDLAPFVGACPEVLNGDTKRTGGDRPFVFANIRAGQIIVEVAASSSGARPGRFRNIVKAFMIAERDVPIPRYDPCQHLPKLQHRSLDGWSAGQRPLTFQTAKNGKTDRDDSPRAMERQENGRLRFPSHPTGTYQEHTISRACLSDHLTPSRCLLDPLPPPHCYAMLWSALVAPNTKHVCHVSPSLLQAPLQCPELPIRVNTRSLRPVAT
jgi:hypothetical protein